MAEIYPIEFIRQQEVQCPRCKTGRYTPYGKTYRDPLSGEEREIDYVRGVSAPFAALSRRDNATYICSDCGDREAFEDMGWEPPYQGPVYWITEKAES